jgi:hypothetical protein
VLAKRVEAEAFADPVFMLRLPSQALSRRPKNRGPFQRVPVMANATWRQARIGLAIPGKAIGTHGYPLHSPVPFTAEDGAGPHLRDTPN